MIELKRFMGLGRPARGCWAVLGVVVLLLGPAPAWAGVTYYDISLLLFRPHPWSDTRLPVPAGGYGDSRPMGRVGGGGLSSDRRGGRAGQPAVGGPQSAGKGAPGRQKLRGPYSLFFYGGWASRERFTWTYQLHPTGTQLLAVGMTARLHRYDFGLEIEGEVGLGRRFGDDKLWEFWTAVGIRWRKFPWNHIVDTTFGLALFGFDYTTDVPPHEIESHKNKEAKLLNFFSPELTLALPERPDIALLLRLHHRSPIFGVLDEGAATFFSAGLRLQL